MRPAVAGVRPRANRRRAALAALIGAAVVVPTALSAGAPASAKSGPQVEGGSVMPSSSRAQLAPNVVYPLPAYSKPRDLKRFKAGVNSTDLVAACSVAVRAVHPGTVRLIPNEKVGGTMVTVETSDGRLTTSYGFLSKVLVTDGQILTAGQPVGKVGDKGNSRGCMLRFKVATNGDSGYVNPTTWLETNVGKPVPDDTIFGNTGFLLGSINALGASHSKKGGSAPSYPSYVERTTRLVKYVMAKKLEVVGLQEFQKSQYTQLRKQLPTYAAYPPSTSYDTENSIIWDTKKFKLESSGLVNIPYFNGQIRRMPFVQLKQLSTKRMAWFINVHNPADTKTYKNQGKWRTKAVQIEKDLMIRLRGTGKAVFLTGDMNDRQGVYCAVTGGKLALSADGIPSVECLPPPNMWIDWIFAAGPARFSTYVRDWSLKDTKTSDHPAVYSKTYLAEY